MQFLYLIIAFLHWLISFPLEQRFYTESTLNHPFLATAKLILLIGFWQIIGYSIKRYKKDIAFQGYIKHFAIYFVLSMLLLLLTWPGNWGADELWIIDALHQFKAYPWQHYLTQVFYFAALTIFPSPALIPILLLVCISLIVASFITSLAEVLKSSKLAWLGYTPFFLPAVLTQNIYPIRSTLFAYLLLLLIVKLLLLWWRREKISTSHIVQFVALTALLSTLRGEGIYLAVAIPLVFCITFWKKSTTLQKTLLTVATVVCTITLQAPQNTLQTKDETTKYRLTTYMAPLNALLVEAEAQDNFETLETADQYIDRSHLGDPLAMFLAFWADELVHEAFYDDQGKALFSLYLQLIKQYPETFFKERLGIFLYSAGPDVYAGPLGGYKNALYYEDHFENDPFARILSIRTRDKVLLTLQLMYVPDLIPVVQSTQLPIAFILIICLLALLRRQYYVALIVSIVFPAIIAVFLTAPDVFFMYYFPYYLIGHVLAMGALLIEIHSSKEKKRAQGH